MKFLEGKKIYLRPLTKEDCGGNYLEFANDTGLDAFVQGLGKNPHTSPELEAYVESNNRSSNLLLGIFEPDTDIHVGNVHISSIVPIHNRAYLGIVLHRSFVGKGYAREAISLAVTHAFETLNINRIESSIVDANRAAIKLYESLGAVKEGVLREAFYYKNRYHDFFVYSFIKKDWRKKNSA